MVLLGIAWQGQGCNLTWHNPRVSHQLSCKEESRLNAGRGGGGALLALGRGEQRGRSACLETQSCNSRYETLPSQSRGAEGSEEVEGLFTVEMSPVEAAAVIYELHC